MRAFLYLGLGVLYVLHNDWWLWDDDRLLAGLPIGMVYHIVYCLVAVVWMALLVKLAWPRLEASE